MEKASSDSSEWLVEEIEAGKATVILPSVRDVPTVERPTRLLWGLLGGKQLEEIEAGQKGAGAVDPRRRAGPRIGSGGNRP